MTTRIVALAASWSTRVPEFLSAVVGESMTRSKVLRVGLRLCLALLFGLCCSLEPVLADDPEITTEPEITSPIEYSLRPMPTGDRTNLEIEVRFAVSDVDPFEIQLLADNYGTPNLHESISDLRGESGTQTQRSDDGTTCKVTPQADGRVHISYVISYDPREMDSHAYGPHVTENNFHVAGCQWMLRIGNLAEEHEYAIELREIPDGWEVYSTLAADPAQPIQVTASFNQLIGSMLGGGSQFSRHFDIRGRRLSVFVQDGFELSGEEIAAAAEKIVRAQRAWLNDYDQPFYNITLLQRSNVVAGNSVPNMFVCFLRPTVEMDAVTLLCSHEMFHAWLPNKCRILRKPGDHSFKHEWFSEGFTEYFARRILLEVGLIDQAEFVRRFNRDIRDLMDNPSRLDTYAALQQRAEAGEFRSEQKKLAYIRGALIALNWETQLREQGSEQDLQDFIRNLVTLAGKSDGEITEEAFFAFGEDYGLDIVGDFQRHMLKAEPIEVTPGAFGAEFPLRTTTIHLFHAGFDVQQSRAAQQITGVSDGGPAFEAGLRDGMKLVSLRNSSRFSNSWFPDRPIIVTVEVDGQEREIEYLPRGEEVEAQLFEVE